jgi:hypothetical protein
MFRNSSVLSQLSAAVMAKARAGYQASPCGNGGGQSGTETVSFPSTSVFAVIIPPMPSRLSHRRYITSVIDSVVKQRT